MNSSGRSQPSFLWTRLFLNKVLMVLTSSSNKPFPPIRADCRAGPQSRPVGITEETSWFSLITPSLSLSLCGSLPLSVPLLLLPPLSLQISLSQWLLAPPMSLTRSLSLSVFFTFVLVSSASIPLIIRWLAAVFHSPAVCRQQTRSPFEQDFQETVRIMNCVFTDWKGRQV